ncbi:MAG: hypothetical protein ACK5D5_04765 [Bacteroidota bacterium]
MKSNTLLFQGEDSVNYLNVVLILLSSVLAYYIPFHLFLFVYAFLGPLHYLTEISWLEKRNFYVSKKFDVIIYVLLCIFLFLGIFFKKVGEFTTPILIFSVVYTIIILTVKNNYLKYFLALISLLLIFAKMKDTLLVEKNWLLPIIIFSVLLPTLVHVYFFTGVFLLGGALKQNKFSAYLSVFAFIICSLVLLNINSVDLQPVSAEMQKLYDKFKMMNKSFMYVFGYNNYENVKDIWVKSDDSIYANLYAKRTMSFIAFAYCYHYLNWFSKTTVIKWHQVSKIRLGVIFALWVLSVGVYIWDYKIGFYTLFILSMMHVFLEFPLNYQSFKNVISIMIKKLGFR